MLLFGGNRRNEILRRLCFSNWLSSLLPSCPRCSCESSSPVASRKHCVRVLRLVVSQSRPRCPPPDCLTVAFSTAFLLPPTEVPVSSVLCLSSVRELPVQVRDLYAQGFVLVAVHPFVHPCGPRHAHIQRQLHRAVLVRETPRYASTHTFSGTADAITIKDRLVPVAAVLVTSHSSQTLY